MKLLALGPKGTNGHEAAVRAAAWKHFAKWEGKIDTEFCRTHQEILERTEKHRCLGIVAIENDAAGLVNEVVSYFALNRGKTQVIAELTLDIHMQLLVHPKCKGISSIKTVISHEKALAQCAKCLAARGFKVLRATNSTAEAARQLAEGEVDQETTAVLASPFAGQIYGLKVSVDHMEDEVGNHTRFYVLGPRRRTTEGGDERTGVVFGVPYDIPGSIDAALSAISYNGVNKTSLDRVRLGSKRNSVFFVEFDQHRDSPKGKKALTRLHTFVSDGADDKPLIRVLGSWPVITT